MKAYLMDWGGTLDQAEDPVALIRKLQEGGDCVFLHSARLPPKATPAAAVAHDVLNKGNPLSVLRERLASFEDVIIVDDEPWCLTAVQNCLEYAGKTVRVTGIDEFLC